MCYELEIVNLSPEDQLLNAVSSNNLVEIESLITANPKLLDHVYEDYNRKILLYACSQDCVQPKTIQTLLKLGANSRDDNADLGWEAIHFAADINNFKFLEVLLEHDPKCVNAIDRYGMNALHCLESERPDFLKCAELLITSGIDISQMTTKGLTIFDTLDDVNLKEALMDIIKKHGYEKPQEKTQVLLKYVYNLDEENCIHEIDKIAEDYKLINECYPGTGSTLLQLSCKKGLHKVVKHLLNKGADPKQTTSKDKDDTLVLAATCGHRDILETLLEKYNHVSEIPDATLARILILIDSDSSDYKGCYKIMIKKFKFFKEKGQDIRPKINIPGTAKNTALHYAVWFAESEGIEELLRLGAYLGAENTYAKTVVRDIDVETLKSHLDECVTIDSPLNKYEQEFRVKFNINSLVPIREKQKVESNIDNESIAGQRSCNILDETKVFFEMSNTPELKLLLVHPVIVSVLALKWRQYQWLFWTNFIFYIIFAISLLLYVTLNFLEDNLNDFISYGLLQCVLTLTLVILALRELFQVCKERTNYYKIIDNYVELALIMVTFAVLYTGLNAESEFNEKRQLYAISVLLLSYELISMLGRHPYFSTHLVMLKTVAYNFFCSFATYFLLVLSFALSFFFMFGTSNNNNTKPVDNSTDAENDTTQDTSFDSPIASIFKILVMLTGEFDSSSLQFGNIFMSRIIFISFVFMMHLILLNLLNGLAVSDTQQIRNEAELFGHIARIEYIRSVESTLSGNGLLARTINAFQRCLSNSTTFRIQLKQDFDLGDFDIQFYPNKNKLFYSGEPNRSIKLDPETIERILSIVRNKKKSGESKSKCKCKS